jgi:hypothetical protein
MKYMQRLGNGGFAVGQEVGREVNMQIYRRDSIWKGLPWPISHGGAISYFHKFIQEVLEELAN